MSAPKNSRDAEGADEGACWICLLAHLIRHISCCLSSLTGLLSPASLAYSHTSTLARLLDHLLLSLPPQQQQYRLDPPNDGLDVLEQDELFPNSLLQLDIFRALLFITDNLRVILSTAAKGCGDEASQVSACIAETKEEVGLLNERELYMRGSKGCLEGLLAFFQHEKIRAVQKGAMTGMSLDSRELSKRFMEFVSDLQKYSDNLELPLRKVSMEISSMVALMTSRLASNQQFTISATRAYLRTLTRAFLYTYEDQTLSKPEITDLASHHGDERLTRKADEVIEQLLNPQGPRIVGLGGGRGIGKTCLASHVACNQCISANFPGGVFYLSMGPEPDLTTLQAQLWKRMCSGSILYSTSKATFSTSEEGTVALMSRAQEGLPCLLVLDDVCDVAHVKPFFCFDSNDRGRVLVISRVVESILENWKSDAFVLVLEPLDEEEASDLFDSIAGCQDTEKAFMVATLTRNCAGIPRLIEAAAGMVYFGKARTFALLSVASSLKQGVKGSCEAKISNLNRVVREGEKFLDILGKGEEASDQQRSLLDSIINVCIDALAEVHPCFQECFLDLAAFPRGKWVSLSTFMDVWSFGNRLEKERAIFALCFLASQSLVEWKVEESVESDLEQVFPFNWRLIDIFHEHAQAFNESRLKEGVKFSAGNNKEERIFSGNEKGLDSCEYDANGVLDLLRSTVKAFDLSTWFHTKQITSCVHKYRNKMLHDVLMELGSKGLFSSFSMPLQTNCRFFFPGWHWDYHMPWWHEGHFAKKATKLSLISTNLTELPTEEFCELKVALLSNNASLRSIPESPLKCMERLVVLDLKKCASLTLLPNSISCLQCLEVLELSLCTQLLSLPQTIGKLRNLKYLCLSGCLSLTSLPVSMGRLVNLTMLDLSMCSRLRSLPKTLVNLLRLELLNLSGCYSLQCLPGAIASLRKLHTLVISGCSNLCYSPPWFQQFIDMVVGRTGGAMAVPPQFWRLSQIEVLHLCSLKNLSFLPQSVGNLQHLRHLNLSNCRSLDYLPDDVGSLFLLEKLDLSHTAIRKLPPTLGQLSSLVRLCLQGCSRLLCLPVSLSALPKLESLDMAECWDFVMLPAEFGNAHALPKLVELDLSGCSIKNLPCFAKGALPMLQRLNLASCENLCALPDTFGTLTSLQRMDLEGCKSLASLQGIHLADLKWLQWINIRNCLSLTSLPVSELLGLQSLKFLDVSGCTKLSPFPEPLLQGAREQRFALVRWGAIWH